MVHIHEPVAPVVGWDALTSADVPIVGTFHCYSENRPSQAVAMMAGARRKLNHLHVRIAVSEAAAWTGKRFYGGRYRVIPNGVVLPDDGVPAPRVRERGEPLRIVFVGQSVERKGLPVLLRAFEALRGQIPAELTVVGVTADELAPLLVETEGVRALGRVDDDARQVALRDAHVLCAPSLGGESFGMVLTEAFAAGTPVVASDIAGYRDVISPDVDGVLVPRGDPTALAETLRDLALDPARVERLAGGAAASAERYAWPRVAEQVVTAYEDALAVPEPESAPRRAAVRIGMVPADGLARVTGAAAAVARSQRARPREADPPRAGRRRRSRRDRRLRARRPAHRAVADRGRARALEPAVGAARALALMCASMLLRAVSWHAILKAALPDANPRMVDAVQGTTIGVLMSATLPARLGEPSRALVVARRLGRARDRLPAVLGTIVSQTLINVVALMILGAVMFITIGLFAGKQQALRLVRAGADRRALRGARRARADPLRQADPLALADPGPRRRRAAALRPDGLRAPARGHGRDHDAARAPGRCSGSPATSCSSRSGSRTRPTSARRRRSCSRSTSPPSCRSRRRTSASSRPRAWPCSSARYGVPPAQALGYGIILQAVEVATAVIMGGPALVKEGLSWREVRLRALHSTPVSLSAPPKTAEAEA